MTNHRLRVLHLSDLHERGPREREPWRRRRVLGAAWEQNLDELVADGTPIDLVCFTGDLADWGLEVEYGPAGDFFSALLNRLRVPRDRFFVVPGNHDIQRRRQEGAWKRLRPALLELPSLDRSRWIAGGRAPRGLKDSQLQQVLERETAYRNWLESFGLAELLPDRSPHGRLGFRATRTIRDLPFPVHIIGLDSAWLSGDDSDSGRLVLTEDQVARLALDDKGQSLPGLRLALMHHPLQDLADERGCRELLAAHVDLLLRGHLHHEDLSAWVTPAQSLRSLAAGCLYEGDRANTWPNACHLIEITLDEYGRPKHYDVRLRGYSDRGAGFWFDDGSLYREAPQGRLRWQITPPSVRPPAMDPPQVFVGREAELRALEAALLPAPGTSQQATPCAVRGMGGVGKSYLVERFVALHRDRFPGGMIRILLRPEDGRSAAAIEREILGQIGDRLKVPLDDEERLRRALLATGALVHLEDADSVEAARAAVSVAARLPGCPVVVTGRYQELGKATGWLTVPVDPLDESTALAQIEEEIRPARTAEEREGFRRLARELGYLPLALHLAAGLLREGDYTVETCLQHLHRKALDIEPELPERAGEDSAKKNLRQTLQLSLNLLEHHLGDDAHRLYPGFTALAYAPTSGFGRSLGAAVAGLEPLEFDELVAAARKLSLLLRVAEEERPDGAWRIHPLLSTLLRSESPGERAYERMNSWFLLRLPGDPSSGGEEQRKRWMEVNQESQVLRTWLEEVPSRLTEQVICAGSNYAMYNGPFDAWAAFCERGLEVAPDDEVRCLLLWTLASIAPRAGMVDRALDASVEMTEVSLRLGDERRAALAAGIRADILQIRGELDESIRVRKEEELPVYERLGDAHWRAVALGKIADILQLRGELDESLAIRKEVELPTYERLGDMNSRAVTLGKIADIAKQRGDLDGALRVLSEEIVPFYERLGASRSYVVALGKIADIHFARGELDEALRIRQEELPIHEKLGDVANYSVVLGKIADVLAARGELDEALRIRREQEFPLCERLGDIRGCAITLGKIADVLMIQGKDDEALEILTVRVLPLFERLGDIRSRALARGQVANILTARGKTEEALRIRQFEQLPVFQRLGDARLCAVTMRQIAEVYQARGDVKDALRVLRSEVLPVFERLGDVRERAVALMRVAKMLLQEGDVDEAHRVCTMEVLPVLEKLRNPVTIIHAHTLFGRVLLRRSRNGDRAQAREMLILAQQRATALGLLKEVEQIRRLLRAGAPPLRVRRLEIRSFKNIAHLDLDLDRPSQLPGRWTCLAGINGSGKSAVLQALILVLLGDNLVRELGQTRLAALCRRTGDEPARAEIRAWVQDEDTVRELYLPLGQSGVDIDALEAHPGISELRTFWRRREAEEIVLAYGPGRNLSDHLDDRYNAYAPDVQAQMTLFDPHAQVAHANLLVQRGGDPSPVLATLRKVLEQVLAGTPLAVASEGPGLRFLLDGASVSPVELPDGFRATIAWLADLCAAWHRKAPEEAKRGDLATLRAIVLADEIDLHLHHSLQRTLIPNLRRALPQVQWIVTTHSPLILSSFDRRELVLLEGRAGHVRELDRQVLGFSVDEIYRWLLDIPPRSAALDEAFQAAASPDAPEERREELAALLAQSPEVDEAEARTNLEFRKALAKKLEEGPALKRAAPPLENPRPRRSRKGSKRP